jgi:hypothetical protein
MTAIVWAHQLLVCADDIYFVWEEQNTMKKKLLIY